MGWQEQIFASQFERYGDGYVYFPSRRSGGLPLTREEYEGLRTRYVTASSWSWRRFFQMGAALVAALVILSLLGLADDTWSFYVVVAVIVGWQLYPSIRATLAPRRLVKGRTVVTPPRASADARRALIQAMPWWMIGVAVVISGGGLIGFSAEPPSDVRTWLWFLLLASIFPTYVFVAVRKIRDR